MTITAGVNSFTTEVELYSHLSTRLNGDSFTYLAAVFEAGIADQVTDMQATAQIVNDMRGATLAEIEAALTAAGITYDAPTLTKVHNTLIAGKTAIQIKNAQALILATQLIDQFDFVGLPTDTAQPLQWPRVGAVDRNRQSIPDNSIPAGIKTATAELAYFLLQNDTTDPAQYHHIFLLTSYRVGESQSSYGKRANKKLPDNVMDLLKPFLLEKSGFSSELIV